MPWCTNCRSEYIKEITACSTPGCDNAPLVDELPPDPVVIEVYAAADALEAQHIAGLLRDAEVEVAIADHGDYVFPTPASDGSGVRIAVVATAAQKARELIESARTDEVISTDGGFLDP